MDYTLIMRGDMFFFGVLHDEILIFYKSPEMVENDSGDW